MIAILFISLLGASITAVLMALLEEEHQKLLTWLAGGFGLITVISLIGIVATTETPVIPHSDYGTPATSSYSHSNNTFETIMIVGFICLIALTLWIKVKTEMGSVGFTICLLIGVVLLMLAAEPFKSDKRRQSDKQDRIHEHQQDQREAMARTSEEMKKGNTENAIFWNDHAQKEEKRIKELKGN